MRQLLYDLIYGQYPNAQAAQAALKQLPVTAKREGAFITQYATVQAVIKRS